MLPRDLHTFIMCSGRRVAAQQEVNTIKLNVNFALITDFFFLILYKMVYAMGYPKLSLNKTLEYRRLYIIF